MIFLVKSCFSDVTLKFASLKSDRKMLILLILSHLVPSGHSHGRLIDPPSRASAWRYGFNTPHNYNDHELYCGGFTRQWIKNAGKCGICGDPWDSKTPRLHEFGGTYGQGVIVRRYHVGATINIRVELTANHFGYFTFALCPDYKSANQQCLDKTILTLVKPQEGVDHQNHRYYPTDGNKVYEIKYKLPKKSCPHCLLQWRYIAGNNWGNCPNGTGAVGCGPQEEFRACADIEISGKETEVLDVEVETIDSGDSQQPITTLILSLLSFLVVCLVLFLLYFHFYRVGERLKLCLKRETKEPVAPPRFKRGKSCNEHEGESAA